MVIAMSEQLAARLSVASLNTRGIAIRGSRLASRYTVIGTEFEAGRADVVCFQEVFTYWHLRLLARRMPSFRHVSYRPSALGPAGGLVTFSRRPVSSPDYQGFGASPNILTAAGVRAESVGLLLTGKVALPGGPGYASDHIGLYANLLLASP